MKYLLDVNALIALGFLEHEFHERVAQWVQRLSFCHNILKMLLPI